MEAENRCSTGKGTLAGKQDAKAIDKLNNRINQQLDHVGAVLERVPLRDTDSADHSSQQRAFSTVVVVGIDAKKRSGSPAAPNRWKMRILVADSARQLTVPPIQVQHRTKGGALEAAVQTEDWFGNDVYALFRISSRKRGESTGRFFTGNLIKGV